MRIFLGWRIIPFLVFLLTLNPAAHAHKLAKGFDWIKLDTDTYIGIHCLVADGSAQAFLNTLGPIANIADAVFGGVIKKLIDKGTLSEGETYCVYMLANRKFGDDFDRRELLYDKDYRVMNTPTVSHLANYERGKRKDQNYVAQTCSEPRCITDRINGTKDTVGFAACFEPTLASGKKSSVVVRFGEIEGKPNTGGLPKQLDKSCEDRRDEFLDETPKAGLPQKL